jgi:hypothetical protein
MASIAPGGLVDRLDALASASSSMYALKTLMEGLWDANLPCV